MANHIAFIVEAWSYHNNRSGGYGTLCEITRTADQAFFYVLKPFSNATGIARGLCELHEKETGERVTYYSTEKFIDERDWDRFAKCKKLAVIPPVSAELSRREQEIEEVKHYKEALDKSLEEV